MDNDAFTSAPTAINAESLYKTPALVTHSIRCGKSRCRCATTEIGHGPYHFLYWRDVQGRQRRRYVPAGELDRVRVILSHRRAAEQEHRAEQSAAMMWLRDVGTILRELDMDVRPVPGARR